MKRRPAPRCPSTPGLDTPGTQALTDLVHLAEEGMTLTQYGSAGENLSPPRACLTTRSRVSAFVVPTCRLLLSADNDPPLSGFVPEPTETSRPPINQVTLHSKPPLFEAEMYNGTLVRINVVSQMSVSRLCGDLGSMVNNPQLSDVQLQVDSGDVYFAHSFMLYARCPLLANMVNTLKSESLSVTEKEKINQHLVTNCTGVFIFRTRFAKLFFFLIPCVQVHDAGFGVQEEGFAQAQRALLNDVSGEAVHTLLQYLYTAACHLTHTLVPDVLQLASRSV